MLEFILSLAAMLSLSMTVPDYPVDSGDSGVEAVESGAAVGHGELYDANSDMQGYIYLPNGIEYPVMFTPYNQNYYIDHDFNRAESKEGLPFLNRYSRLGMQGISLMYGHNLRSGRGFAVLRHYLEDEGYLEENRYIQIDTLFSGQVYEVAAVALTSLDEPFDYYEYVGCLSQREFQEWRDGFETYCIRGSLSELSYKDTIMELSTCYYHKDDGRLVVVLKSIS